MGPVPRSLASRQSSQALASSPYSSLNSASQLVRHTQTSHDRTPHARLSELTSFGFGSPVSRARTTFPPNTPQLELDNSNSVFAHTSGSAHSPIKNDFSPLSHRDSISSHHPHTSVSTTFAGPAYPPPPNGGSSRTPLLESAFDNDSDGIHKRALQGLRGRGGRGWPVLSSRTRLHPVVLIPTFVVGALMAMSGLFGSTLETKARICWPRLDVSWLRELWPRHGGGYG